MAVTAYKQQQQQQLRTQEQPASRGLRAGSWGVAAQRTRGHNCARVQVCMRASPIRALSDVTCASRRCIA
eukprot:4087865-Lingulodinium_polyedra.AAC.1